VKTVRIELRITAIVHIGDDLTEAMPPETVVGVSDAMELRRVLPLPANVPLSHGFVCADVYGTTKAHTVSMLAAIAGVLPEKIAHAARESVRRPVEVKPAWPTSTDPEIAALNELVYKAYPPRWERSGWMYGRLYYLGSCGPFFGVHQWMLDGMTPVEGGCVVEVLHREGFDVSRWRRLGAPEEKARPGA
jgi:hypothetical protein